MEDKLIIETKIEWEEFRNLHIKLLFDSYMFSFMVIFGILGLFIEIGAFLSEDFYWEFIPILPFTAIPIGYTLFLLITTWINAWNSYHSNSLYKKGFNYIIDHTWIRLKGEDFDTKVKWNQIKKVSEANAWFLIYLNKINYNLVYKKQMSEENIVRFRALARSIPNLKLEHFRA